MTLVDVRAGTKVKVCGGGDAVGFSASLAGLGIHVGDEVVVVRSAPFRGPVLVEVPATGVRVALGRGMAERVRVEPAIPHA